MEWRPAAFHKPIEHDLIQCHLCPLRCGLRDGEDGSCRVRRRRGGGLETAAYNTSAVHVQAVERKPLFHFRPGSEVVTIAPPGCTFRCDYCVNHRVSQYGRDADAMVEHTPVRPGEIVRDAALRGAAVGLSYTEPSLAAEVTLDLAAAAAPLGVPLVWKSNGFLTPEALDVLAPALAAVNIDLKAADDAAHRRLTGAPLAPVLETVRALHSAGVWVEVSTPLIPGASAEPGELRRIAEFVASVGPGIPWHVLRLSPAYRMRSVSPSSPQALAEAVRIGRAAGLRHVYVERALGDGGRATRCPGCEAEVVRRGLWRLEENRLLDGRCPDCAMRLEGRW
ncbi:AmmeMemoRadiSam system radical SAM enzyme [Kitasatospora sp. NPDC056651]|uniref:AmmeMemoRadiSam system radical SAM enzyme n=1 Tax=Kitasatospora sp. NPDC056651 TaxID=3345892 RepID=UPI0036A59B78